MKKALLAVAALALVAWVVSWFWAKDAVVSSAAHPWPQGLGTLDSAAARFPPMPANAAAGRLAALGNALPKGDVVDNYVWREIERGELVIGNAPKLPDVAAIRELLLHEQVVWERREGIGGDNDSTASRGMQMRMARALAASALVRARANDASAWEDLHAVWKLARSLDPQPQMSAQTAALAMARMINALAWKLPLPAPAWFGEVQQRDFVPPLLASFHYQAASYWNDGMRSFPTKWLASAVEHDRQIAEIVAKSTACEVNVDENQLGVDVRSVWHRAFRYRAEREATANALRVREGKAIETKTACSDGTWSFDGTTLRFSHPIASSSNDRAMPLVLRVTGPPQSSSR